MNELQLTIALVTRSKSEVYDKQLCVICQKPGGKVHRVGFESTGKNMRSVAEKLSDKSFFRRLNAIG